MLLFAEISIGKTATISLPQLVRDADLVAVVTVPADSAKKVITTKLGNIRLWEFNVEVRIKQDRTDRTAQYICEYLENEEYRLLHDGEKLILFGKWNGYCYAPIRGYRGAMAIDNGIVNTVVAKGEPESAPLEAYVEKLKSLVVRASHSVPQKIN
jgi:hypothetical protein